MMSSAVARVDTRRSTNWRNCLRWPMRPVTAFGVIALSGAVWTSVHTALGLVSRRTVAVFAAGAGLRAGATGSAGADCVDVHLILLFVWRLSRPNTDADGWRAEDITVVSLRGTPPPSVKSQSIDIK